MAIAKRRFLRGLGLVLGLLMLGGCEASQPPAPVAVVQDAAGVSPKSEETRMWMTVGERRFAITLADTAAARAFAAQLPLTLDMAELNGKIKEDLVANGLLFNAVDPAPFREKLRQSGFYVDWRRRLGEECWTLLEEVTGTLA